MTAASVVEVSAALALALLALALVLAAARAVVGPRLADRVVAIDLLSFLAVGVVGALALLSRRYVLLDAAMIPALIGFVATVALSRHLEHREGGER